MVKIKRLLLEWEASDKCLSEMVKRLFCHPSSIYQCRLKISCGTENH